MKEKSRKKQIDKNFFKEMSYELAGDIGAIDNEEMKQDKKLINGKNQNNQSNLENQKR